MMERLARDAALAEQAARDLGITGGYWWRVLRGGKVEIRTPWRRHVWTAAPAGKRVRKGRKDGKQE